MAAIITDKLPKGNPMVAPVAIQQGILLAANLTLLCNNKPLIPFKYIDKGTMATVGKNRAVVEIGKKRFSGMLAWFIWMGVHLISLVGFRSKIIAFFSWTVNYFNNDKSMRTIISPFTLADAKRKRKLEIDAEAEYILSKKNKKKEKKHTTLS